VFQKYLNSMLQDHWHQQCPQKGSSKAVRWVLKDRHHYAMSKCKEIMQWSMPLCCLQPITLRYMGATDHQTINPWS